MASKLKLEAIQVFGGKCQCPKCPIIHPDLLQFSHVNRDGGKNRVLVMYNGQLTWRRPFKGDSLLRRLKKANWTNETLETGKIQMLCQHCHTLLDKGVPCDTLHSTT